MDKSAEKLDVLFNKAYLPVFMEKLASAGVPVNNEEDLVAVLKIAAATRGLPQVQASQQVSLVKAAAASLEKMLVGQRSPVDALLQDAELVAALK